MTVFISIDRGNGEAEVLSLEDIEVQDISRQIADDRKLFIQVRTADAVLLYLRTSKILSYGRTIE